MKKHYSVLLLYPDYIADTFGQETYYAHVQADNPAEAIIRAQTNAIDANPEYREECPTGEDFYPLLLLEGKHYGLEIP
jgi:hypothetical protein